MKKLFKINLLLLSILLVGCRGGRNKSTSESSKGSDTSSVTSSVSHSTSDKSSSSHTTSESESIPSTTKEITFNTSDSIFGGQFSEGMQFSSTEHQGDNKKLVDYLCDYSVDPNIVSSIDCESCSSQFSVEDDTSTAHLTLGTQKSEGTFTINFKYFIKQITLNVQAYYSTYIKTWVEPEETVYNVDDSTLVVEEKQYKLDYEADKPTTATTETYELTSPKKSIKLANKGSNKNRVFVNSMTIVYYA